MPPSQDYDWLRHLTRDELRRFHEAAGRDHDRQAVTAGYRERLKRLREGQPKPQDASLDDHNQDILDGFRLAAALTRLLTTDDPQLRERYQIELDTQLADDEYVRIAVGIETAELEATLRYLETGNSLKELIEHYKWREQMKRETERDRILAEELSHLTGILSDPNTPEQEKVETRQKLDKVVAKNFPLPGHAITTAQPPTRTKTSPVIGTTIEPDQE